MNNRIRILASKQLCFNGRYFLSSKATPSYYVFDRNVKKMQRNRIASSDSDGGVWLKEEIGHRVADRIFDIKRSFNNIVDLGSQRGYVVKHLTKVRLTHIFFSY